MKKIHLTIVLTLTGLTLLSFSACKMGCLKGSGKWVTENRKVTDFKKLNISGAYNINLKQDSTLGISITADDNLLKNITTEVSGDELVIKSEKNICSSSGDIVINIGVRNIEAIKAAGAVKVTSNGKLVTKNLNMDLTGAIKIDLDVDAADVTTTASGAAEINLKGQASSHSIELNGGGKVHAFDFIAGNYNITTAGAADCEINVLHELSVNSSGASTIKYKGNPTTINNKKSGVSTITKVN